MALESKKGLIILKTALISATRQPHSADLSLLAMAAEAHLLHGMITVQAIMISIRSVLAQPVQCNGQQTA